VIVPAVMVLAVMVLAVIVPDALAKPRSPIRPRLNETKPHR
jgi:hypothetical protein